MSSQSRKRKRHCSSSQTGPISPSSKFDTFKFNSHSNAVPSDSNPNLLCENCRSIDFSTIFITPVTRKTGSFVAHVGTSSSLCLNCPFCTFLSQIISQYPAKDEDSSTEYALRAFSSSSTIGHLISRTNISFMPKLAETSVLGLVTAEPSNSQGKQRAAQEGLKTRGYISPTSLPASVFKPYITARPVQPADIDYTMLRSWTEFCEVHHRKTCTRLENTQIPRLRLIDCETRKVIEEPCGPNKRRYAVMSYVWGLSDKDPTRYKVCPNTGTLPDALPAVIRDAMKVVLELKLHYLWVDRYCIVQDDEADVLKHMEIMDLIYNHAYVTIVAAAGKDSSYGLPGVSVPKLKQPVVRIGNDTLVCTLPDPQAAINESIWMTRGWTYQEALFSLRRLIFTPTQVYFECNNMHTTESVNTPLKTFHTSDLRRFRTCLRHGMFRGGFGKRCWPLSAHIVNYSTRHLTFDSDILRGMLGVFRAFEKGTVPVRTVMGVPVEFDLDLLNWKQQDKMRGQYIKYPWRLHASFARGLCWWLKEPGRRREGFPSWSWSGWKGELLEWFAFETLDKQEDPEVRFEVAVEGNEELTDLGALYKNTPRGKSLDISYTCDTLDVEAWSFAMRIVPKPLEECNRFAPRICPSYYTGRVELKSGKIMYSDIYLLDQDFSKNHRDLGTQNWTCLVLAYRKQASRSPVAIVIKEDSEIAERVGLVDFWVSWETDESGKRSQGIFDDRAVEKRRWRGRLR